MNDRRLIHAVGFIDDDLISEAAEYRPKAKKQNFRAWKFAAAGCAAAAAVSVIVLKNANLITTDKSSLVSQSVPVTDSVPVIDSVPSVSDNSNSASAFSAPTLDEWLNDPGVIWGEKLKGEDPSSDGTGDKVQPGEPLISDELSELMDGYPDGTVFAVMVVFVPFIDKAEMENWEYNGDTIARLNSELKGYYYDTGKTVEVSYIKDGEWVTEYEPIYDSDPEDADKIADLIRRIDETKSAYYGMKIESFRESFSENGLGVYVTPVVGGVPEDDGMLENRCFYTFATREQLENFKLKDTDAFVFRIGARLK